MVESKKISVVIPLFNRQDLITQTLISIENQQLLPYEVIVVDDNCTDNSVTAVKEYMRSSRLNIKIFENKLKKGMSGALNYGIKMADGEFVAMQDSDDLWTTTHLDQLMTALMRYENYDIAFSKIEVFGDAGDVEEKSVSFQNSVARCLQTAFNQREDDIWLSNNELLFALFMYGFPFRCQASLIKKDFFEAHGLFFDQDITYTLDSQFMTIAAYYSPFIFVNKIGLKLRRHCENDGDKSYGKRICESYNVRVQRLKKHFHGKTLNKKEQRAFKILLCRLQSYVMKARSYRQGLKSKIKEGIILLIKVPCFESLKSALKLLFED